MPDRKIPVAARPISESGLETWQSFLQAHAAVISGIEQRMRRRAHLSIEWYDLLVAILSSPRKRLRMSALSERLVLTRSNATRLVDRLEAAGLVRRVTAAEDGRGTEVLLTRSGLAAIRRAWPVYASGINELFLSRLSGQDLELIGSALRRVALSPALR